MTSLLTGTVLLLLFIFLLLLFLLLIFILLLLVFCRANTIRAHSFGFTGNPGVSFTGRTGRITCHSVLGAVYAAGWTGQ